VANFILLHVAKLRESNHASHIHFYSRLFISLTIVAFLKFIDL